MNNKNTIIFCILLTIIVCSSVIAIIIKNQMPYIRKIAEYSWEVGYRQGYNDCTKNQEIIDKVIEERLHNE